MNEPSEKMAPLESYRKWLGEQTGQTPAEFDENDGGVFAKVLMLHNFPTKTMTKATRDNPDASAKNVREIHEGVLDRTDTISWNAIPYYFDKTPPVAERRACEPYLEELLRLLDNLQVVILSGSLAWEKRACIERVKPDIKKIIETNHPGNQGLNAHGGRQQYVEAVRCAAAIIC
jgi:hypothetical protein